MVLHRHPSLRRKVSHAQFVSEFSWTWSRGPRWATRGRSPQVRVDEPDEEPGLSHCRDARRYAEVDVSRRIFYFAPQALLLPWPQRLGLFGHEVGHVLTPGGTERDADEASRDHLGVLVSYDRRWPGRGLQTGRIVRR